MIRATWLVVMGATLIALSTAASGDATRDALTKRAQAGDVQAQVALGRALQDDGVEIGRAHV